jgi:hypothetical protein
MKPEGSLPRLQVPDTCPYPEKYNNNNNKTTTIIIIIIILT